MRLLSFDKDDNLAWTEYGQDNVPPYAILSHTWGTEEVTFLDLITDNSRRKAGRRKIEFCGEQAARDRLRYFWVDTCCIDKRDNTELTEAINSMFRWYRNAAKCYTYLSDVSVSASSKDMPERMGSRFPEEQMVHSRLDSARAPRSGIGYVLFFPAYTIRR
jgi:hypothetical protein